MAQEIFVVKTMGDALRNTGYRNIESAIAEIVDNSVQANAKDIFFTPSGCASNTLATHIVTNNSFTCNYYYSPTAHKSILHAMESVKSLAFDLKVDHKGS